MQARFHCGTYVGRRFETNELYIAMQDGKVVKARDYKEVAEESAWNTEAIHNIVGTPWGPTGTVPLQYPADDEDTPTVPEIHPVDGDDVAARGLSLRVRHFKKIGFTPGCAKCRSMERGERTTAGHNPTCRARALKELGELDEFRHEVEKADQRVQEAIAKEIETVDAAAGPDGAMASDSFILMV